MRKQYQNANGNIGVRGDEGAYIDTAKNFTTDFGQPPPSLHVGILEQLYEPGRRHAYGDGDGNVIGGGPEVWESGDVIIASLGMLLSAQKTRRAAEQEAYEKKLNEEADAARKAKAGEENDVSV